MSSTYRPGCIGLESNMARHTKAKKRRLVVPSWISIEETKGQHRTYCGNKIKTTKYTFLSFIPKNLFEQLHRFANIYFIFLAALNFVPIVNAFQPEVGVIPILLVMAVTSLKDLWEDQRRRVSDRQANNLPCKLYNRWTNVHITWMNYTTSLGLHSFSVQLVSILLPKVFFLSFIIAPVMLPYFLVLFVFSMYGLFFSFVFVPINRGLFIIKYSEASYWKFLTL